MIRRWLLKHRWVNESLKAIVATFFALFGYAIWEAGKLAAQDIPQVQSYKLMVFGIVVGIMGMLALFILVDIVYSLMGILRKGQSQ